METTATLNATPATTPSTSASEVLKRPDKYIWAIYLCLCLISIVEIYSASSREVTASNIFGPIMRQGVHLVLDTLIVIGLSRVNYKWFIPGIPFFAMASALIMIYVLFNGQLINGARRAISILGFTLQPSELLKLSAVLIIALIMSRNQTPKGVSTRGVVWSGALVLFAGGLLFSQGLTNTILLMAISLSMMLIAGLQWRKFFIVVGVYILCAGLGLTIKGIQHKQTTSEQEHVETVVASNDEAEKGKSVNRMGVWVNRLTSRFGNDSIPIYEREITNENRQETYGYMAQANGRLFGVLPGNSRETARLPLAFSDYIYSIIVEDWGFVGGMALLLLYLSLLARAGNIARRCSRAFPALLVLGMAVMIVFQALFHMAIVTGVFPVSGQPLPMISKGGSSMLVTAIAFGIMLSVSRFAVQNNRQKDIRQEKEALPESVRADNPTQIP